MSVSDGPDGQFGSPTDEPLLLDTSLQAEAASELAQELTLVAAAMFAQLLPGSAARALAGVPGLVESDRVAAVEVAATRTVPFPTQPHPPAEEPVEPVAAGTPALHDAVSLPAPAPADPATPTSVPLPLPLPLTPPLPGMAVPAVPVVEIPLASEVVPLIGIPVAAAALDASPDAATDPSEPHSPKADPRSMLMLDEIAFLDEEE